jgi:hypothetical protein
MKIDLSKCRKGCTLIREDGVKVKYIGTDGTNYAPYHVTSPQYPNKGDMYGEWYWKDGRCITHHTNRLKHDIVAIQQNDRDAINLMCLIAVMGGKMGKDQKLVITLNKRDHDLIKRAARRLNNGNEVKV